MCVTDLITGTGTVRWRAEGAALGSQSELSPELMSPSRIRRLRKKAIFLFVSLPPQLLGGVGGWAGGGAARGCPTPEPFHTTKICTTGMLFTPKAFQGSEKSTVDLSFSLLTKEGVEVRDKFPAHFLSPSVGNHGMCATMYALYVPRGNLLHSS